MIVRLILGLLVSLAFSGGGWRAGALSGTGAVAAVFVGTAVITGLSWPGAVMLGTFFVTSSVLSHRTSDPGVAGRGSRRDYRQVLANGGVPALAGLGALAVSEPLAFAVAAGALAAAMSDTWATEIGSTADEQPRLLLSREPVPAGVSGGVTRRGTLGALAGAGFAALVAGLVGGLRFGFDLAPMLLGTVVLAGFLGMAVDSLLGELVQERRWCPSCNRPSESAIHRCGTATEHTGGVRRVDNDVVNVVCTLTGAVVGLAGGAFLP